MIIPLLLLLAYADGNTPPPERLIEKAISIRKAQEDKGLKFTWREDEERRNEKGEPVHPFLKTYDIIMLEGDTYRKLILQEGRPLDATTARKVEQDLEKTREERKKHRFLNKIVHLGTLEQLNRLFDSKVVGEEVIEGRKTWRIESIAKADAKPANPAEEELLASFRITWIDEEEGIDLRRSATYIRNVHKIQTGTRGQMTWSKVGDAWVPSEQTFHGEVKYFPGITGFGDVHSRYYDYKRFAAESTFMPN